MPTAARRRRQEAQAQKLVAMLSVPNPDVRRTARQVVELRSCFEYDGRPDWAGRSQDYRDTIYRVYKDAGVPSDSLGGIQANLRYHIGNVVREVAPREDLIALGLDPEGPRGRAVRARKEGPKPRALRSVPGDGSDVVSFPVLDPGADDRRGRPRLGLEVMADPVALAGFALDALRAIRELGPRGEMAQDTAPLVRQIVDECLGLTAQLSAQSRRSGSSRTSIPSSRSSST